MDSIHPSGSHFVFRWVFRLNEGLWNEHDWKTSHHTDYIIDFRWMVQNTSYSLLLVKIINSIATISVHVHSHFIHQIIIMFSTVDLQLADFNKVNDLFDLINRIIIMMMLYLKSRNLNYYVRVTNWNNHILDIYLLSNSLPIILKILYQKILCNNPENIKSKMTWTFFWDNVLNTPEKVFNVLHRKRV